MCESVCLRDAIPSLCRRKWASQHAHYHHCAQDACVCCCSRNLISLSSTESGGRREIRERGCARVALHWKCVCVRFDFVEFGANRVIPLCAESSFWFGRRPRTQIVRTERRNKVCAQFLGALSLTWCVITRENLYQLNEIVLIATNLHERCASRSKVSLAPHGQSADKRKCMWSRLAISDTF